MIRFTTCRIASDGKHLLIGAMVDNLDYYKDVYLDTLIIDTDETYSTTGPSDEPLYTLSITDDARQVARVWGPRVLQQSDVEIEGSSDIKRIDISLTAKDLGLESLQNNIFFVYVIARGTPASDTPCNMDNATSMQVALDWGPIYLRAMQGVRELAKTCVTPKGYIDSYLRYTALKAALASGNFSDAISFWQKYFRWTKLTKVEDCGCAGNS